MALGAAYVEPFNSLLIGDPVLSTQRMKIHLCPYVLAYAAHDGRHDSVLKLKERVA